MATPVAKRSGIHRIESTEDDGQEPVALSSDPNVASPVPDLYSIARPLALWFFGGMGTLGLFIGTASFGFAWSASERMTRVETQLQERTANMNERLARLEAQLEKVLDKLDKLKAQATP